MKICQDGEFLFFTMMQAAIRMDEMGKSKKDFIDFAGEIWESLKLNDRDKLKSTIADAMMLQLSEAFKFNDKGD